MIFLHFINFLLGLIIFSISCLIVWIFIRYVLFQEKIDKQILYFVLINGILMVSVPIFIMIFYFPVIEIYLSESLLTNFITIFFLMFPFPCGLYLIFKSVKTYNKEKHDLIKEKPLDSSKLSGYVRKIVITILIFGAGGFLFLLTEDTIISLVGIFTSVACMPTLTYLIRQYCVGISYKINKEAFNKKLLHIGEIGALILLILVGFLSINFYIPPKPAVLFLISLFIFFEILIIMNRYLV